MTVLRNQRNRSKAQRPSGLWEQRQMREQTEKIGWDRGSFKGPGHREGTEVLCREYSERVRW